MKAEDDTKGYEFNLFSFVNLTFGALDGILNAMPKGGLLSNCGINLLAQRTLYINASNLYADRELTEAVTNLYKGMQYIYKVNYNCYYGAISVIN